MKKIFPFIFIIIILINITVSSNNTFQYIDSDNDKKISLGDIIRIEQEEFLIIENNEVIKAISKHNLSLGNKYKNNIIIPLENPTYLQDEKITGYNNETKTSLGTISFSTKTNLLYNNSDLKVYIENYKTKLKSKTNLNFELDALSEQDLNNLKCDIDNLKCNELPEFIKTTSFWTKVYYDNNQLIGNKALVIIKGGELKYIDIFDSYTAGVRPVIKIKKEDLSFNITINDSVNGKVILPQKALPNEKVFIKTEQNQEYILDSIKIINKSNNKDITNEIYNKEEKSFIMPSNEIIIQTNFKKNKYKVTVNNLVGGKTNKNNFYALENTEEEVIIKVEQGYKLAKAEINKQETELEKITEQEYKLIIKNINEDKKIDIYIDKITYNFIDKGNDTYSLKNMDKNNLYFELNTNIPPITKITLKEENIDTTNFRISGNRLFINKMYLNNLKPGTYPLELNFDDGAKVKADFKVVKANTNVNYQSLTNINTNTIDNITYNIIMIIITILGIIFILYYGKKGENY